MDQYAKRAITRQWLSSQGLDMIGGTDEELDWVHAQFSELIESNQMVEGRPETSVKK